jgi:plastocyanin
MNLWLHSSKGLCAWAVWAVAVAVNAGQVVVQVTDDKGVVVPGAVVFLDSAAAARAVKPLLNTEMVQRDKAFVPVVLPVTRGTSVAFPNQDTVRHHVYSFSPVKRFELKLYTGVPAAPVVFDQPGVAVLGCNIHDQMVGWVLVLDTPYFATANPQGRTTVPEVPAGEYTLRVWHQRLPVGAPAQAQRVRVGEPAQNIAVVLKGLEAP